MSEASIREIDFDEGIELLGLARVGRVAFVDAEGLQLLPVNFATDGKLIYFRTHTGSALAQLTEPTDVAFEADFRDDLYRNGWNVTAHGRSLVPSPEQIEALETRPNPWTPGDNEVNIALTIDRLAGRRVRASS